MVSAENSTSTTGPMIRATRPVTPAGAASVAALWVAVVMTSLTFGDRFGQRVGAADDLADFLGDLGLPGLVGFPGEGLDQVVGVVGRRLHGTPPGGDLGGR